jgi:hypothetical protein
MVVRLGLVLNTLLGPERTTCGLFFWARCHLALHTASLSGGGLRVPAVGGGGWCGVCGGGLVVG